MKICWDNLEKLRYNKNTGKWYNDSKKGYILTTYHYKDKCKYCDEPFLSAKNKEEYCCKSCSKMGWKPQFTKEWKANISKSTKGKLNGFYGKTHTYENKKKMSSFRKGKKHTKKTKEKLNILFSGKNNPMYGIRRFGKESPNWKGGKSSINAMIRSMREYGMWRIAVFKRDNFTCLNCGKNWKNTKGLILNAHHIIPISKNYSTAFVVGNGRTLCENCHIIEHKKV